MKCVRCGRPGVYTPSWLGRPLCKEHFIEAFRRRVLDTLRSALRRARIECIVAAVSGGKDSIAMLDVLKHASSVLGFRIVGLTIDLGIPGYSRQALEAAVRAYNMLDVEYVIVDASEAMEVTIRDADEAWRRRLLPRPTCSLCGFVKRSLLERYAKLLGCQAIATGHNLDDVIGFEAASEAEFAVLERGELVYRLRPLLVVNDADTLAYVTLQRLPYVETPCPYKPGKSIQSLARWLTEFMYSAYPSRVQKPRVYVEKPRVGSRCVYCGRPSTGDVCGACWFESTLQAWKASRANLKVVLPRR